ncbi:nuclear transport factor 2 family protein [Gelidibacter gilvus]|uniref:Nuclear transport factor 2 family protein n=1 Tax=Gelidibacter gilvus TaxID=59602 RepID=A0A4Q0XGW4_9FLAO|nr:hypothetical protein [Gelidibacter gilvus]RXJ50615.1 hypothetical protein ESZ48_07610 [Gelidibacter gilvus]
MKTLTKLAIVILLCIGQIAFAQDKSYKEVVVENPTAEQDIQVVSSYLDAILNNKMDVLENLLAVDYVGSGPSHGDKESKREQISNWKANHQKRTNQTNEYVYNTFRVLSGDLKGDWVSVWGTYSFTENGKNFVLPYQITANVIDDNKIQKSMIYYDNLAMLMAMDYTLSPPK